MRLSTPASRCRADLQQHRGLVIHHHVCPASLRTGPEPLAWMPWRDHTSLRERSKPWVTPIYFYASRVQRRTSIDHVRQQTALCSPPIFGPRIGRRHHGTDRCDHRIARRPAASRSQAGTASGRGRARSLAVRQPRQPDFIRGARPSVQSLVRFFHAHTRAANVTATVDGQLAYFGYQIIPSLERSRTGRMAVSSAPWGNTQGRESGSRHQRHRGVRKPLIFVVGRPKPGLPVALRPSAMGADGARKHPRFHSLTNAPWKPLTRNTNDPATQICPSVVPSPSSARCYPICRKTAGFPGQSAEGRALEIHRASRPSSAAPTRVRVG